VTVPPFATADHALVWYRDAVDRGVRAFDPVATRGWLWAHGCEACGFTAKRQHADGEMRCKRCNCLWPRVAADEPKRRRRRRAGVAVRIESAATRALDLVGDLGRIFDALPPDDARVWALYVLGERLNRERVATYANAQDFPPGNWTDWRVRAAVRRCRRLVELELDRRGWLEGGIRDGPTLSAGPGS